ncbi:hypothetical protein KDK95_05735 [Actinospica sp. MGRD01-02]|uniref:Phosphatidic acid phosphatase type 2/haloperoxidase domain-containing protein n=1 Tax=Actinospica acidithermotolerans TaxID=2828514 RepID=A0A941E639_9ACTN|nr:hypothetical protein [Actinospica acidithermotolerans]MBR7825801.1 hypothetical protein [Actinospica acidithermotolerans]
MNKTLAVLARIGTELGAPWVLVILVAVPAGFLAHHPWWGAALALVASVLPQSLIVAHRGFGDRHARGVDRRFEYAVTILPVLAYCAAAAACRQGAMALLAAVMILTLLLTGLVTGIFRWKASVHAAVASGAVLIWWALGLGGRGVLLAFILPVWISWSRVRVRDHTVGQVWAGATCGVVAGIVFALCAG